MITTYVGDIQQYGGKYMVDFCSKVTMKSRSRNYIRGFKHKQDAITFRQNLLNDMLTYYTFNT